METVLVEAIAAELAAVLGDQWRGQPDREHPRMHAWLVGTDGARLQLRLAEPPRGRLLIVGRFTAELQPHARGCPRHQIRVSLSRTAEQIARDISRRLLPGYYAILAAVRENHRAHAAQTAAQSSLACALAAVLRGCVADHDPGRVHFDHPDTDQHGDVHVPHGARSATFTVQLPSDRAVEFARLMTALHSDP